GRARRRDGTAASGLTAAPIEAKGPGDGAFFLRSPDRLQPDGERRQRLAFADEPARRTEASGERQCRRIEAGNAVIECREPGDGVPDRVVEPDRETDAGDSLAGRPEHCARQGAVKADAREP